MTDAIHVTPEVLKEFQSYLQGLEKPERQSNLYIDLPLDVILDGMPSLSDGAQKALAFVISSGHGNSDRLRDIKTMLNMAEKYPALLGYAYTSGYSHMYSTIQSELQSRPFEQNIPAIYTLLHYGPIHEVGIGDITKTSTNNTKLLNEIFAHAKKNSTSFDTNAHAFIQDLNMSQLLNFRGASPEFREFINHALVIRNIKLLENINPENITEKTLALILRGNGLEKPQPKSITNAKTQQQKNVNILPKYYTKVRDALLALAEKQEIHDRNNYGAQKTLSQSYKELCAKLMNVKSWEHISPELKTGLINEAYLIALQRDILDGNADKLTQGDIQMVLNNDKQNFYIRQIPDAVLQNTKAKLNPAQQKIVTARDPSNINTAIDTNALSLKEKRELLAKAAKLVHDKESKRQQLETKLAAYDSEQKRLDAMGDSITNLSTVSQYLATIQQAYDKIKQQFKNGQPNNNEVHLIESSIEGAIYDFIAGGRTTAIDMPNQGSLPLFGRGAEKERRESLESAIKDLNDILIKMRDQMTPDMRSIIAEYKNSLLQKKTLGNIDAIHNGTQNAYHALSLQVQRNNHAREGTAAAITSMDNHKKDLTQATEKLAAQETHMRSLSQRHLGHDQTGKLTPATSSMTPEEKRATRKKNKEILNDKLAARRGKKPARNLSEMLANADMDR